MLTFNINQKIYLKAKKNMQKTFLFLSLLITIYCHLNLKKSPKILTGHYFDWRKSNKGLLHPISRRNFTKNHTKPFTIKKKEIPNNKTYILPDNFDLREQYPNCESIKEITNEDSYSVGWALSTISVINDRICIASGQTDQRKVSAVNLISCSGVGCNAGLASDAWSYWKNTGIVTGGENGCQPYMLPPCQECVHNCDSGNKKDYDSELIFGSSVYSISGEENMMKDIYENGSVQAAINIYDDFLDYRNGVYQHITGSYLGGLTIKIIGWGVENNVKYWLCVNFWGEDWGDNGYIKILRGSNECGIERTVYAGLPKL